MISFADDFYYSRYFTEAALGIEALYELLLCALAIQQSERVKPDAAPIAAKWGAANRPNLKNSLFFCFKSRINTYVKN